MCCSDEKAGKINRKQEQRCGMQKQHHAQNGCCCTTKTNEIDDPDLLRHRLECYSGKVEELRSRIAEVTNEKE